MAFDFAGRLVRVREETERAGLGGLVVAPSADMVYLVGYDPPPLERPTALVIVSRRDPILLVPQLERPRAEASPAEGLVSLATWSDGDDPYAAIGTLLPERGWVAVSDRLWSRHLLGLQSAITGATFVPGSSVVSELRRRKDAEEVDRLTRAARAADRTFDRLRELELAGRQESDLAAWIAATLVEEGHESSAFTIVASGPNAASPHHEPAHRVIGPGDPVVLDFGGRVDGYCSDITRTVAMARVSPELAEIHDIVHRAQRAALDAVRPGVPAQEVDRAARRAIREAGYGDAFVHRTGHGIGLEEHEDPYLVEGNAEPLLPGMCFSIEPGVYLAGRFGVRIEDIVCLGEDGPVSLNEASRELVVVA